MHTHTHALTHVCTQTYGRLLKCNRQSSMFTSVRPHSFDRERIQTEWNPHQHGSCAIDLSSPFADWQNENWGRGVVWPEHNHCISVSIVACQHDTGKKKERQRERNQKWKEAGIALSFPLIHIRNHHSRRQDANIPMRWYTAYFRNGVRGERQRKNRQPGHF